MPEILILQHADWELPGAYEDLLTQRGFHGRVVRPDLGERLPDVHRFAAVLAMGGPMSVNDDVRLPWLAEEKQFIRAATSGAVPFLGTCLGAQLLAAAHGARVYPGPEPEYGTHPVALAPAAADDPAFAGLPDEITVFQWHGETFDVPTGGVRLAGSADVPNQAFRFGRLAYGLQFHLEVTSPLLATWLAVPQCLDEARRYLGNDADQQLTKQVQAAESQLGAVARHIVGRWLTAIDEAPHRS